MDLRLSTSNPRLFSETVVFFSSTVYRYFRWLRDNLLRVCDEERNQLLKRNFMAERGRVSYTDAMDTIWRVLTSF